MSVAPQTLSQAPTSRLDGPLRRGWDQTINHCVFVRLKGPWSTKTSTAPPPHPRADVTICGMQIIPY